MAMDINGVYVNYAGAYTNQKTTNRTSNSKVVNESGNSTGQISSVENENSSNNIRKTAADELKYLSKKYGGYTFAAANFQPGMRYGSNKTTNVAISPDFLQKMANDPELEEEYEARKRRSQQTRLKLSKLPYRKTLEEFDFEFQPSIDREQINELGTLVFAERKDNVLFLGPPGVGKTHLAVGLALNAIENGKTVYFTSLPSSPLVFSWQELVT